MSLPCFSRLSWGTSPWPLFPGVTSSDSPNSSLWSFGTRQSDCYLDFYHLFSTFTVLLSNIRYYSHMCVCIRMNYDGIWFLTYVNSYTGVPNQCIVLLQRDLWIKLLSSCGSTIVNTCLLTVLCSSVSILQKESEENPSSKASWHANDIPTSGHMPLVRIKSYAQKLSSFWLGSCFLATILY